MNRMLSIVLVLAFVSGCGNSSSKKEEVQNLLLTAAESYGPSYSPKQCEEARRKLIEMGPSVVEILVEVLKEGDQPKGVIAEAADVLRAIGDGRAAKPLLETLKKHSDSSPPRISLMKALVSVKRTEEIQSEFVEYLLEELEDKKGGGFLPSTIEALGDLREPRAVDPLIGLLNKENIRKYTCYSHPSDRSVYFVRETVAIALGKIGDAKATGPLEEMLRIYSDSEWWETGGDGRISTTPVSTHCFREALEKIRTAQEESSGRQEDQETETAS